MVKSHITSQLKNHATIIKASFDTAHTGRFMVNVGLSDIMKRHITGMLAAVPLEKIAKTAEVKEKNPHAIRILTIVDNPHKGTFNLGCRAGCPTILLEPETAATMAKNAVAADSTNALSSSSGASPQLHWLSQWACNDGHWCMSDDRSDEDDPDATINILRGLFCNTDIVVILDVFELDRPNQISFYAVTEATMTPDGKLVPTYEM